MKIIDDLISSLNLDARVQDIRQGFFHTAVVTRQCGLAATLPKDALQQTPPLVRNPGIFLEKGTSELVRLAHSNLILEAAIGMAAINSLLDIDLEQCLDLNAGNLLAAKGAGKSVAVVGHFPFVSNLSRSAKTVWVLEKNPREGDFSETEAENLIPRADVVGITGTSLTNHTLDHLLKLVQPKAFVVLIGDTAPLSRVLWTHGIDAVCGTCVINPAQAIRYVSQGANFRQIKGVRRLTLMKP